MHAGKALILPGNAGSSTTATERWPPTCDWDPVDWPVNQTAANKRAQPRVWAPPCLPTALWCAAADHRAQRSPLHVRLRPNRSVKAFRSVTNKASQGFRRPRLMQQKTRRRRANLNWSFHVNKTERFWLNPLDSRSQLGLQLWSAEEWRPTSALGAALIHLPDIKEEKRSHQTVCWAPLLNVRGRRIQGHAELQNNPGSTHSSPDRL